MDYYKNRRLLSKEDQNGLDNVVLDILKNMNPDEFVDPRDHIVYDEED